MRLVVVIPAYNESSVIGDVLTSLPSELPGITHITPVVVNDNSTDDTQRIVESHGAYCIRHELNLGAGGATITGLEMARKLKADIVITMDGDGQHAGSDIAKLVEPVIRQQADVVIGTRLKMADSSMPRYKRLGNNLLNAVTYLFFRIWVSDSQSGYKAFSKKALNCIQLKTIGYEVCSEIIGEIKAKKLRYCEVPIETIYTDYSRAKGQAALNAVNIVLGLLLRSIRH